MPVIGMISAFFPSSSRLSALREGLKEAGYIEGQNVAIEHRTAEGRYELMPELVADLLRKRVTAIAIPGSALAARAAKERHPAGNFRPLIQSSALRTAVH